MSGKYDAHFMYTLGEFIPQHLEILADRTRLFNKVLHTELQKKPLTKLQKKLIDEQFPIIFLSESDKIKPYIKHEYRSPKPLKLGEDIKMIATDNAQHRTTLRRYLVSQNLFSVQVVLVSELEKAAKSNSASPLPSPLNCLM